ncbi:MAG TPA: recombination mediator RecR [Xanthomonadales bacterium]|nr:recombination mediator RecR [Xanthomonadales bacterium]
MASSSLLIQLVDALRCLPGVGPKTAQRMAFHLLERDRDGGKQLAATLLAAMERIGRCSRCRDLTEETVCRVCSDPKRDNTLLCVLESPSDVLAIEQATGYRGLYYVLMGRLSPLDGIGPAELGLENLAQRLDAEPPAELIIATNPTVEGETTAIYLQRMAAKRAIPVSRIAHGVPLGGELEFTDQSTIAHAFASRLPLKN